MLMKQPEDNRFFVFGALPMVANRLQALGDKITGEVTFKQWHIMLVIRDMPYGSSVAAIAAQHGSSRQNVKKLLDTLVKRGLVQMDPYDKRSYAVYLTDEGWMVMNRVSSKGDAFIDTLFAGMRPEDISATRRVLFRMLENLQVMGEKE